ncbi:uncharacterized protein L969DRAFT_92906 [Mixia osmundae IAM 14324]|uniref:Uncharacterized protein n=1 Tax=Mixia osmundae (strain CBS 9802 / IAM 14324 / JCM 22182 / KY 12970) TaxID=764103 RepID=G7DTQ5_MIXOS|nr:uncharacterized protein L969DRAFT_92906 [Mixia osmundae IAM 14324]KEI41680.1 hypothetical protein L969DRAFT_92906 [Mixia osmundae IAM 14324]GAA93965.1 hypothetical protein E5Q_00611 [Mixia osmundae IAM 14324]
MACVPTTWIWCPLCIYDHRSYSPLSARAHPCPTILLLCTTACISTPANTKRCLRPSVQTLTLRGSEVETRAIVALCCPLFTVLSERSSGQTDDPLPRGSLHLCHSTLDACVFVCCQPIDRSQERVRPIEL